MAPEQRERGVSRSGNSYHSSRHTVSPRDNRPERPRDRDRLDDRPSSRSGTQSSRRPPSELPGPLPNQGRPPSRGGQGRGGSERDGGAPRPAPGAPRAGGAPLAFGGSSAFLEELRQAAMRTQAQRQAAPTGAPPEQGGLEGMDSEPAEPGELEEPVPKRRKHTDITWSTPPRDADEAAPSKPAGGRASPLAGTPPGFSQRAARQPVVNGSASPAGQLKASSPAAAAVRRSPLTASTPPALKAEQQGAPSLPAASPLQQRSAAEIAAAELADFKQQQEQEQDYNPDAPAAMKRSPSISGEDEDLLPGASARSTGDEVEAEGEPARQARSRWMQGDDEEGEPGQTPPQVLLVVPGEEEAAMRELNERERRDLEETGNGEVHSSDDEDDSVNEHLQGLREVSMLQACRSADEFEKLNHISEGTYGVVYRARDRKTKNIVALKKVKLSQHDKDGFPLTAIREINVLLSFHHPNIVNVSEVVVGGKNMDVFMVMEFMDHDLKELMEAMDRFLTIAEVKTLMKQLLDGIAYLHENWILHRDIKTSNILYNQRGELKICDFGLARQYGEPLRPYTSQVVTQWYRPPELFLGAKTYSTAVDVWSLGCIMAELLSKKILFQGKGEIDQLKVIFDLLGNPTEQVWPGWTKLPAASKLQFPDRPYNRLRERFPERPSLLSGRQGLSTDGYDLLNRMLHLCPDHRISAEDARHHPWFKEHPTPMDKEFMPHFPSCKTGSGQRRGQRPGR